MLRLTAPSIMLRVFFFRGRRERVRVRVRLCAPVFLLVATVLTSCKSILALYQSQGELLKEEIPVWSSFSFHYRIIPSFEDSTICWQLSPVLHGTHEPTASGLPQREGLRKAIGTYGGCSCFCIVLIFQLNVQSCNWIIKATEKDERFDCQLCSV